MLVFRLGWGWELFRLETRTDVSVGIVVVEMGEKKTPRSKDGKGPRGGKDTYPFPPPLPLRQESIYFVCVAPAIVSAVRLPRPGGLSSPFIFGINTVSSVVCVFFFFLFFSYFFPIFFLVY